MPTGARANVFGAVRAEPMAENFHSLRKRVKDIWYQARILQNLDRTSYPG